MKLVVAALLFSCLLSVALGFGSGISSTVFSLPAYQTENGGFHSQRFEGVQSNVEHTEHALFLSSLFGLNDQISVENTKAFLDSLATSDNGFSDMPGQSSDLEAVRNAIFSYAHLNELPPDTSNLVSYINSLYDTTTKLFRNGPGGSPDYKATANALEIFHALGYKGADLEEKNVEIAAKLKSAVKREEGKAFFSSITADNYFAILVGHLSGFEFSEPSAWVRYFTSRQISTGAKKGGFYSDNYEKDSTVGDLEYAVRSIYILKGRKLVGRNEINLQSFIGYLSTVPRGLPAAAHAYSALASTTAFQEAFKIVPTYSVRDSRFKVSNKRVIQGTLFNPSLQVKTTYGLVHPGLTATVSIRHAGVEEKMGFTFNPNTQLYETDEYYDSSDKFGSLTLVYKFEWSVVGFDSISFTVVESKSIGYDLAIVPTATYGETEVPQNGAVGLGTSFNFDLKLGTVSVPRPKLVSGDFLLTFTVLDSSNVAIHKSTLDGNSNDAPISFAHVLESSNIPAGRVTFRFEVSNKAGVHTIEEVAYNLVVRMVATNIELPSEDIVKFGETFTVSMEPATLTDSGSVQNYEKGSRKFWLDLYSDSMNHLASYPGELDSSSENSKYTFALNLPPRFDFIGTNFIFFRYKDAHDQDIKLQNFNSEANELFDDGELLKFHINADLELVDLQGVPEQKLLEYGNEVKLTFKVKDLESGSLVYKSTADAAVFLVLRHQDKDGSTFVSTKNRAVVETDKNGQPVQLAINWEVDPNAVKDKGQLALIIQEADGRETPLKFDGEPWVLDVEVGGPLNIRDTTYSEEFDEFDTSFLVSFVLSCREKKLSGAQLTARVSTGSTKNVIATLPVAAGVDGSYQISWLLDSNYAKSGDYVVDIFRKVDLSRSQSEDVFEGTTPFFTITHYHQGRSVSPLPFKTEFLVLLVLLVSTVAVSMQKLKIEKSNK